MSGEGAEGRWLAAAKIKTGSLFRVMNRHGQVLDRRLSSEAVGIVVKRYVAWLGYDVEGFAGHSLRAGFATSAAGKYERTIMTARMNFDGEGESGSFEDHASE